MRTSRAFGFLLAAGLAAPAASLGHHRGRPTSAGSLVGVSVEVNGRPACLYPAPDGSDRHYLEAREGARYAVHLTNRTGERVGVVLTVDGLNAISGARDPGRGRMYVLDPWGQATVRGWRTSLSEVRQFTFVDEERSYATRSGQANSRMGWIEVSAYRERRPVAYRPQVREEWRQHPGESDSARSDEAAEGLPSAPSDRAQAPAPKDAEAESSVGFGGRARSYPGTGWGARRRDPVVLVSFDPEGSPSEHVSLRYEYRGALVTLGVLPRPHAPRDRLWERDRGESGFAPPPLW